MSNFDLSALSSDIVSFNNFSLTPTDPSDIFEFSLANDRTLGLNLHNISVGDDADLLLYRDSNNNGILDSGDLLVASSGVSGNANDVIRYSATAGTYFAEVRRYGPGSSGAVRYDLDLSAIYSLDAALSSQTVSYDNFGLSAADPTDVFEFDILNDRTIQLHLNNISAGDDADLRLFRDSNGNGIFDAGDQEVANSTNPGNASDIIDYSATAGTYFAQVERWTTSSGDVQYDLNLSAIYGLGTPLGSAIVGYDSFGLSAADPTDVFEFTIANDRDLQLNLHNISTGDDADLRLFRDSNGNGIFDADDQEVARSLNGGNASDIIDYVATAGTYFAQVERWDTGNGAASYDLDLAAVYNLGKLGSSAIALSNYSLTPADPNDVFEFSLGSDNTINLSLNNISAGNDADLRLFRDSNQNGILDSGDQLLDASLASGNASESITYHGRRWHHLRRGLVDKILVAQLLLAALNLRQQGYRSSF
ncbi:MAG: hypothetical protein HC824_21135 [Synechococcales cyanobacterium RM1_1_8]|nr:hypothetical protein [Synechococcales cyanobacterium RM1_1_8]